MLKCEKCHEQAATFFIEQVLDGRASHSRFCEGCAREHLINGAWLSGSPVPQDASEMPLDELLAELLASAPDPDSFAPEDDKWSLQKLAAYDRLHSHGEFSGDEDLADEADEMDSADDGQVLGGVMEGPLTPEQVREFQQQFEHLEPEEREAMEQMFDALEDVHEQLESIMLQHAQELLPELQPDLDPDLDPEDQGHGPLGADLFDGSELFSSLSGAIEGDAIGGEPPALPEVESWKPAPHVFKSAPTQRCPKCRTTWDRLRQDGRAGCASCYETFEEALAESLETMQSREGQLEKAAQHVGKAPRAATRRRQRLETLRARRDSRLAQLRERLAAALGAEQFEEAAKLRDKIKVIESTIIEPAD